MTNGIFFLYWVDIEVLEESAAVQKFSFIDEEVLTANHFHASWSNSRLLDNNKLDHSGKLKRE